MQPSDASSKHYHSISITTLVSLSLLVHTYIQEYVLEESCHVLTLWQFDEQTKMWIPGCAKTTATLESCSVLSLSVKTAVRMWVGNVKFRRGELWTAQRMKFTSTAQAAMLHKGQTGNQFLRQERKKDPVLSYTQLFQQPLVPEETSIREGHAETNRRSCTDRKESIGLKTFRY